MSYQPPAQNPFGDAQSQNPYGTPSYGAGAGGKSFPPGTVKNYLIESILSLVCCGGLIAIPAIVYASQVDGKLAQGDYQGAVEASKNAKLWLTIAVSVALVCGVGGGLFYVVMVIIAAAAGAH